jgi:hypothetical protein
VEKGFCDGAGVPPNGDGPLTNGEGPELVSPMPLARENVAVDAAPSPASIPASVPALTEDANGDGEETLVLPKGPDAWAAVVPNGEGAAEKGDGADAEGRPPPPPPKGFDGAELPKGFAGVPPPTAP